METYLALPAALAGSTFDAVLFDMDGTLIDSVPAVDRCWRRWAAEFDLPDPESFAVPHGIPARLIIANLIPAGRTEAAYQRILDLELHDADGVTQLPGAAAALATLAGRCAVVTSCTRDLAVVRRRAAGLAEPAALVTADDVARGKPAPDPFLLGARLLGVDPARCLAVEDAPAGVASAAAAGCTVLAVTGTHTRDQLEAADPRPSAVVDGLAAVRFEIRPSGVGVAPATN